MFRSNMLTASSYKDLRSPFSSLLVLGALLPASALAQGWISPASTDWSTPGNWSGGNVPDTNTEVATLSTPGLTNPQINANTTINRLDVSANYTLGGDSGIFTIDANTTTDTQSIGVTNNTTFILDRDITTANSQQSVAARVNVAAGSTMTFAAGNTWTTNHGIAFNDNGLSLGGTFNFNGALVLGNNYLQAFNSFTTLNGGVFNFNPSSVTAGASGRIQNIGGPGRLNLLSDFSQGTVVIGNESFTPLEGTSSETYLATNGMIMSRNVEIKLANSMGGRSVTHNFGVDIAGAGTATQAGSISLGSGGISGDNIKVALDVKTADTLNVTGQITGGSSLRAGVTQTLAKTGTGLLRIEGATSNNWTGAFTIEAGTVYLNKAAEGTNAISNVMTTITTGAVLELGKANQIANLADMTLAGGTFDTGGFGESLDQLTIAQTSTIDFGDGASILTFSQLVSGTGNLLIDGWNGSLLGGGADQLRFTNVSGINGYLANIQFAGYAPGAQLIGNEVVPITVIPEPAAGALLLAAGGLALRRKRRAFSGSAL